MSIEREYETMVALQDGDAICCIAAKINIPPLQPIENYIIYTQTVGIGLLNTNGKPWLPYKTLTSFAVWDVP